MTAGSRHLRRAGVWLLAAWAGLGLGAAWAAEPAKPLVLLIHPILSEEQTRHAFAPLADYLGKLAAREVTIRTAPNFLAYWEMLRRNEGYDLVLDAAHFTDYRVQKYGYQILVKIPDTVSYSLVVPGTALVIDPAELAGKLIASLGPPSLGAARLNAIFPNPIRQPLILEVANAEDGMKLLLSGRVQAAILPTPLVAQQMARAGGLNVVITTEPVPHIALSASPRLDPVLRETLRAGLFNAPRSPEGRAMLKAINFERFDLATEEMYAGQGRVLKEYWGY
jgi:ABC-type phosphate/phosphonate transport system substrate-binding protein